ncbi:MAG: hypothetical protein M9939_25115 [Mesorhizobium sp.]|nr:hypothetical protein [Mesorhizobium sp.]MCO5164375.1 hypothetical protein [Mesorhizobium sp.]
MDLLWAFAFALAVGLTIAGFAGSIMEIAAGARLRLAPPFVDRRRIVLSLAASAAAGPFLVNDALDARAARRIGTPAFALLIAIAIGWTMATGIVATELAILAAGR